MHGPVRAASPRHDEAVEGAVRPHDRQDLAAGGGALRQHRLEHLLVILLHGPDAHPGVALLQPGDEEAQPPPALALLQRDPEDRRVEGPEHVKLQGAAANFGGVHRVCRNGQACVAVVEHEGRAERRRELLPGRASHQRARHGLHRRGTPTVGNLPTRQQRLHGHQGMLRGQRKERAPVLLHRWLRRWRRPLRGQGHARDTC
mmetsp:Transcript_83194/g.258353  ORF Transcript_83194/g.258353 Transcript_83194/m.258353 type:complete len:202 (+) Transcript_83194:310-915(+)